MRALTASGRLQVVAVFAAVLLGVSVSAKQPRMTYEGDVVAIDTKAATFTVKGSKSGETTEMAFHVGNASQIFIDGERTLLGGLVKGEHVVVSYESNSDATHTVHRADSRSPQHDKS